MALIPNSRRGRILLFALAIVLPIVWMLWRDCRCSPSGSAAGGALTLLDQAKFKAGNLNPAGTRYTLPYVLPEGTLNVDFSSLAPGANLNWSVDGERAPGARLQLACEPAANHVAVHQVEAAGANGRDVFTLVVIPSATPRRFEQWLAAERQDLDWLRNLPPVYSSLLPGGANPEPEHCSPRLWPTLRKGPSNYHPGAAYDLRSAVRPDGSGHQATYDAEGKLIRELPGAGSADRGAPRLTSPSQLIAHRDRDVIPFLWAAQLDGNPVNPKRFYQDLDSPMLRYGEHMRAYFTVRPAFHAARPEIPPGVCAAQGEPRH